MRRLFILFICLYFQVVASAKPTDDCESLLARRKPLKDLLATLADAAPVEGAKGKVTLMWVGQSVSRTQLKAFKSQADLNDANLLFDEAKAHNGQVVVLFTLSGAARNLFKYLSAQPKDRYHWVDAQISGANRKYGKTIQEIERDVDAYSYSTIPYALGEAQGEVVIQRLKGATYFKPRLAFLLSRGKVTLDDGGSYSDLFQALNAWTESSNIVVNINGEDFVIFSGETLDRLRSVERADLKAAKVSGEIDIRQFADQRTQLLASVTDATKRGRPATAGKLTKPVTYTTTEWALKNRYKAVFDSGPARLGPQRPFAIIAWMKIPAYAVVSYDFLMQYGVDTALDELSAFTRVRVPEAARIELENLVQGQDMEPLSATKLSGATGNRKLDEMIVKDSIMVIAPRADLKLVAQNQQRVVIFPLGTVRRREAIDQ